jgi:hypothetical protein
MSRYGNLLLKVLTQQRDTKKTGDVETYLPRFTFVKETEIHSKQDEAYSIKKELMSTAMVQGQYAIIGTVFDPPLFSLDNTLKVASSEN